MDVLVETFDVAGLLAEVQSTIAPLVAKNNNRLTIEAGPGLGTMQSDQTKLRQNLFNLLSNAAKFTKDGLITLSRPPLRRGRTATGSASASPTPASA